MSEAAVIEHVDVEVLRRTITVFRDLLRTHQTAINRLNVYPVPDGDTGTNMSRTLDAVVTEMDGAREGMAATCDAISHGALMGARGNSGVIVSQILRGLAATFKQHEAADAKGAASALRAASDAAYLAVLKPVEGTILTVVRESAEAAEAAAANGAPSLTAVLRAARDAGRAALASTPELLPVLKDAGVVDAGGAGLLLLLDAALHVVDGEPLPAPDPSLEGLAAESFEAVARRSSGVDGELDVSEQRYEVMFLCHLADEQIDTFKHRWGEIGDSIVVVGGDGTWNCHVHTNDIGAAIEVPLALDGRPFQIRVTDLFEEVAVEHAQREAAITASANGAGDTPPSELPAVTCAVVAVSSGNGISALFRDLGVQVVVKGGQTLNPSTAELLEAVERANAQHVILLPGNKNIIPVAEQVDALTAKTVRVVPTRSMPEGLAALIAYDPELDAPGNVLPMRHAAEAIETGEVTQAVRASNTDAGPIAEGDWMGIVRGEGIVAIAPDAVAAAKALLEHLVGEGRELVTVITGAGAVDDETAALEEWFAGRFPDVEMEHHEGGQPLYPYLFGVE
ncbi:DAK2 domain-containing protein [Desertimonas flava]|uniref:DAK2 domain-containing protein n=1 Tax=Desertimonas flava TaxID=2064846 RepID=UPI000E3562AC|nr:DAK2 domain-containing protein [Desertimonas flava]